MDYIRMGENMMHVETLVEKVLRKWLLCLEDYEGIEDDINHSKFNVYCTTMSNIQKLCRYSTQCIFSICFAFPHIQ